ncbi:helix-turn-helix domain-containing protein [Gordonia sihwensis]|nr:helix-turn-helix transcriptional regulator [Gordonia sihwensis]WFN93437.1 helix-turn-helix transcriptional regulator [Gordonia sihwensis]
MARSKASQTRLATSLGWTQASLSRRLNGYVPFTVEEVAAIAEYLRVPVAVLLGDEVLRAGA